MSGCQVDTQRHRVACLHKGGPPSKPGKIKETGHPCHIHELERLTGLVLESPPEEFTRFLSAIFDDDDQVTVRPTETWEEGGRKKARVIWDAVLNVAARSLREKAQLWTMLLGVGEAHHANTFFGVCPRFGRGEGYELAWQIRAARALWADLDRCTVEEALKRCEAAGLPRPSIIVRSGHGVHLYWLLTEPYLIDDAGPPPAVKKKWFKTADGKNRHRKYVVAPDGEKHYLFRREEKTGADSNRPNPTFPFGLSDKGRRLQDIVGGIASRIGGDHTQDLARLLRLPGTMNRKDGRNGRPAVPCELAECDPARRYPISAFEAFAEASPDRIKREKVAKIRLPSGRKFVGRRLDKFSDLVNACNAAEPGWRSERDFALCAYAVEEGIDREKVWNEVHGVGKFAEKGRAYFDRTWGKAEDKTREKIYERMEKKAAGVKPSANGHVPHHAASASPPDGSPPDGDGPDGEGAEDEPAAAPIEEDDDPHRLARLYRDRCRSHGRDALVYWREEFLRWDGFTYAPMPDKEVRAELSERVKAEFDEINVQDQAGREEKGGNEKAPPAALKVTTKLIGDVRLALTGLCLLPSRVESPAWLRAVVEWPADEVLACKNGLLHLPSLVAGGDADHLVRPTPQFFSQNALDYAFDLAAAPPAEWLKFLGGVWPDDEESIRTLQEWFGYCLLPDTRQQKILMAVGPKRSGKGTIARVLSRVVGLRNVCAPTLAGLGMNFGLWPLLGKTLAVVSDARLSKRTDIAVVVERLLSISGEDAQTIDRKNLSQVTCKLAVRFMVLTNELPRLNDPSGALVGRLVLLRMTRSWFGEEDTGLTDRLLAELPGILLWSIEGWSRLRERGRFVQPTNSLAVVRDLEDLSSPVGAFVRENCVVGADESVPVKDLFGKWKSWCEVKGWKDSGREQDFGRDLRSVVPGLEVEQPRDPDDRDRRMRVYRGVRLKTMEELAKEAAQAEE